MPDRTESDDPKEWMLRAFSNLNIAKSQQSGVFLEDLCFNAQQAVEKAINTILIIFLCIIFGILHFTAFRSE